ncbi:hypothetical protein TNCV_4690491 [Trichonephila clavipes]|nr:hypothetical protein TNCV_4690491 [Trichonephila clavipes]
MGIEKKTGKGREKTPKLGCCHDEQTKSCLAGSVAGRLWEMEHEAFLHPISRLIGCVQCSEMEHTELHPLPKDLTHLGIQSNKEWLIYTSKSFYGGWYLRQSS